MPFKSKRLQPYVVVSFGVGGCGGNDRKNGIKNEGRVDIYEMNGIETSDSTAHSKNHGFKVLGQMRLGLNYVIAKRFISTFETIYQLPFNSPTISNWGKE